VCLAKLVLLGDDNDQTVLLDSVCTFEVNGAVLRAANLFGKTVEVLGSIVRVDFRDSAVHVAEPITLSKQACEM
jgi:predicted RNA-binding protein